MAVPAREWSNSVDLTLVLKYLALAVQAVLPATVILWVGYVMELPLSQWGWVEWLMATPVVVFLGMVALLVTWRTISCARLLLVRKRYSDSNMIKSTSIS
ncbi:MAG: hypothetical protein JSU72_10660 [Deltaproteobacteria bacterium]|nr:MAG: hypothetical protein JSU72_10660 [Deltaproteobacteria bacterium]